MLQIPILSVLIITLLLHTIFTHLFNWFIRKTIDDETGNGGAVIVAHAIEILAVILLFKFCLN